MKPIGILVVMGIVFMLAAAGCTGTQTAATPAQPTATGTTGTTAAQATTQPASVSLGEKYLEKKYSFTSEKQEYSEGPFRVASDPWAIELTVNPLNEDPQYTWFEITATNIDTGQSDTYGYGRTYGFEKHQVLPMFSSGPYKFVMKGNRVSVNVNIAKQK